jgi:hypothetical protein
MARIVAVATTAEIALSAATAKTVLHFNCPANHLAVIKGWSISFDGTTVTAEPVQIRLLRQTAASGTGSTNTPVKINPLVTASLQCTAKDSFSAEPTAGNVLFAIEVHPQAGYEKIYPLGDEPLCGGTGSADALGIECTAPATVNVRATITFEE